MIDYNSEDISFENDAQVEAYSRFFLGVRPASSLPGFDSQEALDDFNRRRERALHAQLDDLREIDFSKANVSTNVPLNRGPQAS